MGFTTEQASEEKTLQTKHSSNPMNNKISNLNKNEFYSFLQDLNYKTEIGME